MQTFLYACTRLQERFMDRIRELPRDIDEGVAVKGVSMWRLCRNTHMP
jgi:hypothetical protein